MRVLIVVLLLLASVAPVAAADPVVEPVGGTTWYLALGDSLAAGYQPVGDPEDDHMTQAGYPEQLWLMARQQYPDLQMVKLACPGEDTETIRLDNGRCHYEHGSQLAEGLAFIEAHRDELAFITIDIGFNDFPCDDSPLCVFAGLENIKRRLPPILAELRDAAPGVPIVGMNIYVPFLTLWFAHDTRILAGQSVVAMQMVNEALEKIYQAAGIPVADVAAAFAIDDWYTLVPMAGLGEVPRNVALLCERTWQCHPPPLGPDRHPNPLGYRAMAEAFARELDLDPVGVDLQPDGTG